MWNNIIISQPLPKPNIFHARYLITMSMVHCFSRQTYKFYDIFNEINSSLGLLRYSTKNRRKLLHQTEEKRFYGDAKEVLISMSSIFYFLSCRTRVALKTIWCLSFKTLKAVVEWDRKKRNTQVVRKNKWHKKSKIIIMQSICRLPPFN